MDRGGICEALEPRALLNAGDLDTSFNGTGKATIPSSGSDQFVSYDVGVQSTGQVVVAGEDISPGNLLVVARYNTNGTLDTSFGPSGNGMGTINFHGLGVQTTGVAIQPNDDKIVVTGFATGAVGGEVGFVARFNADGTADTAFGGGGTGSKLLFTSFNTDYDGNLLWDVAIQKDAKIVMCGRAYNINSRNDDMIAVRCNPDGSLDGSFGDGGFSYINFDQASDDDEGAYALAIDYTGTSSTNSNWGKIVLVGDWHRSSGDFGDTLFAISRLNTDGSLDDNFSGDGMLLSRFVSDDRYSSATGVAIQPAGDKIVIAGTVGDDVNKTTRDIGVFRLNSNGFGDSTFGPHNGQTVIDFGGQDSADTMIIGHNGELIVGGYNGSAMTLAGMTSDGSLDPIFSGDGKQTVSFSAPAGAAGLALAPNNTFVATGGYNFATARLHDRGTAVVSIASLDPIASEAGPDSASLLIYRQERLSTPTRVYLNISGTARHPGQFPLTQPADFGGTNIHFGTSPVFDHPYVDIAANDTFTAVAITPVDDALVEGDETAIFTIAPDPAYDIDTTAPGTTLVIRDNDAAVPAVTSSAFVYDSGPPQRVTMTFSQDVGSSLSSSSFTVTGPSGPVTYTSTYSNITDTATLGFSGILPNGNYTARANAQFIKNAGGTPMAANYTLNFFILNGDANGDGKVDVIDLGTLATNWQTGGGMSFSQGDFNYDGVVDVIDLGILATNWQASLSPAASPIGPHSSKGPPPSPANADTASAHRDHRARRLRAWLKLAAKDEAAGWAKAGGTWGREWLENDS